MNLTPKEAAAKYRSLEYRGLGDWITPQGEFLNSDEVADLRHTLAEAYLEEHPADDEEALSAEFVSELLPEINGLAAINERLRLCKTHKGWEVVAWPEGGNDSDTFSVAVLTTRRALRGLLRGLGGKA